MTGVTLRAGVPWEWPSGNVLISAQGKVMWIGKEHTLGSHLDLNPVLLTGLRFLILFYHSHLTSREEQTYCDFLRYGLCVGAYTYYLGPSSHWIDRGTSEMDNHQAGGVFQPGQVCRLLGYRNVSWMCCSCMSDHRAVSFLFDKQLDVLVSSYGRRYHHKMLLSWR